MTTDARAKLTPVEEVRAAIDVLTAQKDSPRPPFYDRWNDEDFTYGNLDDAVYEGFEFGDAWGKWHEQQRMVDAHLTILRGEVNFCQINGYSPSNGKLDLARAINGTAQRPRRVTKGAK